MPKREPGEGLSHFIGRFVSNKKMKRKYPLKQRLAIAYSEGEKKRAR